MSFAAKSKDGFVPRAEEDEQAQAVSIRGARLGAPDSAGSK